MARFSPSHRERVERVSLRVQPDVRVVSEHLARDVARNRHDGLIARLGLRKLRDGLVAEVVEPEAVKRTLQLGDAHSAARTRRAGIL
ncbi:MAG: hypothetical protein PW792_05110 [Acidobacteriaceae bacterium]|nr:hypothetical protein [Acidobacteriaceae bacterium]